MFPEKCVIDPVKSNKNIFPGVWILDEPPGQYFIPSINLDIIKKKRLFISYFGTNNANVCLIPFINYRQTYIKINDKTLTNIKLPYSQEGSLISFELAGDLTDNLIFFVAKY